ncbi:hypothetical protein BJV78DRAFT_1190541 [Lactifluus subvellereus]|nr:hypothetical protein BJV78DRAFT_1190541 [Lactifluus subvellereus]
MHKASGAIRQHYNSAWRIGGGGVATATANAVGTGGGGGGGSTDTGAWTARTGTGPLGGVTPGSLILGRQVQARRSISSSCAAPHNRDKGPKHASANLTTEAGQAAAAAAAGPGHVGPGGMAGRPVKPTLWDEFALRDRVALVSGANRGLGLEMALVLVEAGARAVYCVDLPAQPGDEWVAVAEYVKRMRTGSGATAGAGASAEGGGGGGRLEYVSGDVRDQKAMWRIGEEIGDREGRMDVCVAAAGILRSHTDCLEYPAEEFEEVMNVNTNGVLYTAQAAGRQMVRFGNRGSIILIASMSGSITNKDHAWVSYNTSKSGVLQMARSMACELGPKGIRVNTLSPGHIYTSYVYSSPRLKDCAKGRSGWAP